MAVSVQERFQVATTQDEVNTIFRELQGKVNTVYDHAMVEKNYAIYRDQMPCLLQQVNRDLNGCKVYIDGTHYDGKTWYFGWATYDAQSIYELLTGTLKINATQAMKVMAQIQQGVWGEAASSLIKTFSNNRFSTISAPNTSVIRVTTTDPNTITVSAETNFQCIDTTVRVDAHKRPLTFFQTTVFLTVPTNDQGIPTGSWKYQVL